MALFRFTPKRCLDVQVSRPSSFPSSSFSLPFSFRPSAGVSRRSHAFFRAFRIYQSFVRHEEENSAGVLFEIRNSAIERADASEAYLGRIRQPRMVFGRPRSCIDQLQRSSPVPRKDERVGFQIHRKETFERMRLILRSRPLRNVLDAFAKDIYMCT